MSRRTDCGCDTSLPSAAFVPTMSQSARRTGRGSRMAARSSDSDLLTLMRAIDADDRVEAARLLAASPALARAGLAHGATRQGADAYFLERIRKHVYAGDTALHVAAAAYWQELAEKLVAAGADLRARNRRGAEPLHAAAV